MSMDWDCIVVGGGAAGLSAALVLGRARRRTLLVDACEPSNLPAEGIGGLLGHDGRPPAELYAMGRAELAAYPAVEVRDGTVEAGERVDGGLALELAGGGRELTRRVILATGMDYRPPDLPGLAPLWGRSVFHCPFCHGWEMRDAALAVLGSGHGGLHRSLLLRGWSDDVVLLSDGPAELEPGDLERLSAAGVEVDERAVTRLVARDGALAAVEFADGSTRARVGLLVPVTVAQRSSLAVQLGAEAAEPGPVAVDALVVDTMFRTTADRVSAAGDVSAQMQQVAGAISAGSLAAVGVVQGLMAEDHGLEAPPVPARNAA
ncbi:MAG TPA: NAD(P)/FAD-dependent oxidoreductase [Thermoleophilaceae bacterium]|nr:NAD(P)/FAD-dependent oxidoreductase [Thermoleophilaceae bacterium]